MTQRTRQRVLVVDDSAAVRRCLATALSSEPDLQVTAVAPDGASALALVHEARPDVVVLDLEMPVMNGFQTLRALRQIDPALPVLVFCGDWDDETAGAIAASFEGPIDSVPKPSAWSEDPGAYVRRVLAPRLRALVAASSRRPNTRAVSPRTLAPRAEGRSTVPAPRSGAPSVTAAATGRTIDLVVLGASTGGPAALARVIADLPGDLGVPVLVVQHMDRAFTGALAKQLSTAGSLLAEEAHSGARLEPGTVLVAPGGRHMVLEDRRTVRLSDGPAVKGCRPSVDVLLRSVAPLYGARALAVVLTGIGSDGLEGCRAIREAGGHVWVQDRATSAVWGMPRAVQADGLAEREIAIGELGAAIANHVPSRRGGSNRS